MRNRRDGNDGRYVTQAADGSGEDDELTRKAITFSPNEALKSWL